MMTGWKTVLVNVGLAAGTAALAKLASFDWVTAVGPVWSVGIVAAINIGLRYVTSTPIFQSK